MKSLNRLLLLNGLVGLLAASARADSSSGGSFVLTKDLWGASGTPVLASADYSLGMAWGEPVSGDVITQSTYTIVSGYYGGGFGNGLTFTVVSSRVGAPGQTTYLQDGVPVGLPYSAPVQIVFSDQVLPQGVKAVVAMDHLGVASNVAAPIDTTYDPVTLTLTVLPHGSWTGDTLYDMQVSPAILNVDGIPLDQVYHVYFQTMLDPHQENVVVAPILAGAAAPSPSKTLGAMTIQFPNQSLSDYAVVLWSRDALNAPLRTDPKIIQETTAKALASGGRYREPVSIQEIIAYDTHGNLMSTLSAPAQLAVDYDGAPSAGLVRPGTLAIWALDETHLLWVKIPASRNAPAVQSVSAPVTRFSVFALMGGPDGGASDSFVFPVPWRPHGPNAGTGPGQTGTEAGGITFSNIPSECKIQVYTIAGELVRQIHHSDTGGLIGQEIWDAKTVHGDPAASGVYLWRVESSVDGKNGKLMIIR